MLVHFDDLVDAAAARWRMMTTNIDIFACASASQNTNDNAYAAEEDADANDTAAAAVMPAVVVVITTAVHVDARPRITATWTTVAASVWSSTARVPTFALDEVGVETVKNDERNLQHW